MNATSSLNELRKHPWTTSTTDETVEEFLNSLSEENRKRILELAVGVNRQPFIRPQTIAV
jgi:hypothetical protein